jgi:hypothetical protein
VPRTFHCCLDLGGRRRKDRLTSIAFEALAFRERSPGLRRPGHLVNTLAEILHFFGVPAIAPHPVHQMAIARTLRTRFDGRTVARIQAPAEESRQATRANEQHMHAMMGEDGRTKAQTIQATNV